MYLCRGIILLKYFTLILFLQTCHARKSKHYYCPTSACGNIRNISYPFRLNTDPEYCGYGLPFELACEGNQTVISLFSKKLHVQAIHYDYNLIHVVDQTLQTQDDLCSFRPMHIIFDQAYPFFLPDYAVEPIGMINCPLAVNNSSKFVEISGCKLSRHTYLKIGKMNASEVSDGCRVEFIGLISWPNINDAENNISFSDFHQAISYGFKLSYQLPSSPQRIRVIPKIARTSLLQFHGVLETLISKLHHFGIFGRKMSMRLEYFADRIVYYNRGYGTSTTDQILGTGMWLLSYFMDTSS